MTTTNNGFSGWYNNTLRDTINTDSGVSDLNWMIKNKLNPTGFDYNTIYGSSTVLGSSKFPALALSAYQAKIKFGIAFSDASGVDKAISYNKAQTDSRKKLAYIVSELEDYGSGNVTPTGFKALLESESVKVRAAGMRFGVYNGWTKQWDVVVKNADFLLLHCYIPSNRMTSGANIYSYLEGRLALVAAEAAKIGKIFPVSILFSCEPEFAQDYFKTNPWLSPADSFMAEFNKKATLTMKNMLIIEGTYMFVTKYGKVSKP